MEINVYFMWYKMLPDDKGSAELLLEQYADFMDTGTLFRLIELISRREGKSKEQVLDELGLRGKLDSIEVERDVKEKIVRESVKRVGDAEVACIMYNRISKVFTEFLKDLLLLMTERINGGSANKYTEVDILYNILLKNL
jgi:hypothetical protein